VSEEDTATGSWERWPEQVTQEATSVVEYMRNGSPVDALAALDKMVVEINERRAALAELANALD
jgi:hypothetical protein